MTKPVSNFLWKTIVKNSCINFCSQDESMDKKKKGFDTSGWKKVNASPIPQQFNGSDCGVFACMFAEHLARDAPFSFSQDNMPYFRKKMIIEILEGKLMT